MTTTCEFLIGVIWTGGPEWTAVYSVPVLCDKVAVRRYPGDGGEHMHLCLEHAKPHVAYAEPCYQGEVGG